MSTCPTCRAVGFDPSILGPDRCSFCDGTEGGHPPEVGKDMARIALMEKCNWKPASVYWRERAEKAEAKLADAEARLELAAGMLEVFQTQTAKFRRDMEAERERCAKIVAKGWGKSVDAIWLEIVGRGQ